jgi:phage-related baseplate assembly protein
VADDEANVRQQRERVIKAFEDLVVATTNNATAAANSAAMSKKVIEVMNKQIDMANVLVEALMLPKDGMRDVVDELIAEIQGLRDDLRIIAKAGGMTAALTALLGGRKR